MFSDFEIKKIKGEEVLYLFIDLKTEFGKLDKIYKKASINAEIDNYIKKNNIKFNGKKVLLMAGGLVLSVCLLKNPQPKNGFLDYNYATNIVTTETIKLDDIKSEEKEEVKEEIKDIAKPTETVKNDNSISKKPNLNSNTSNKVVNNANPPKVSESENIKTPPTTSSEKPVIEDTNKQMVLVKRSNGTVINLELEEYLIGVVAAEMPASFHVEALKAQAIAARTYTLKAINNNITLTDTVSTQVYKDNNQLKSMWGSGFNTYYEKIKNAVMATKGMVITYNGSLINAYYHSTSNGKTEDGSYVFGSAPYLKSVDSEVDTNVSGFLKEITMSYQDISNKLGIPITSLSNIDIERNESGRVSKITIDNNVYDGVKFRMTLGLRSTDFEITLNEDNINIKTKGYGHGVGMSQYGAQEYAKKGWSYKDILTHYYTGTKIEIKS